ncbi:MAG: MBL fold metallo-hydrolase [Candidatus Nomurabacteria bacterium]|jgi:L-ascorbate metabolism protein UlaG (beta-lactamase superfamily)|nr:MBL fold metallo-hydrolase [Candidatus Nomurabacteria bacterium]
MTKILYQGHASLRITADGGQTIYIDPFAGGGYGAPADLVLITHSHFDHNDLTLVKLKPGGKIIRAQDALQNGEHQTFDLGWCRVKAVPAANQNHKITECVGYIVILGSVKIYAAGDTSYLDSMKDLANEYLDYAFLPCDGVYNMNSDEAAKCARAIRAKHNVPYHTIPPTETDRALRLRQGRGLAGAE